MTQQRLPPEVRPIIGNQDQHTDRLYELERRLTGIPPDKPAPLVFSYPGILELDRESPPWYADAGITFTMIRVSTRVAAVGNVIIATRLNGTTIFQTTLPSGSATVAALIGLNVTPAAALTVKVVAIGTANADLTVQFTPG